jgi:hypothetical protein
LVFREQQKISRRGKQASDPHSLIGKRCAPLIKIGTKLMMEKPQDSQDFSENPFQTFTGIDPGDFTPARDIEITEPPTAAETANMPIEEQSTLEPPQDTHFPQYKPEVTDPSNPGPSVDVSPTAEKQPPKQYPQFICTDEYGREIETYNPYDTLQRYLQKRAQEVSFPHEQPHTAEEEACIEKAREGIIAAAAEVGVDITDRMLTSDDYHFFDTNEAYLEDARANLNEKIIGQSGGMYNFETGVLWVRDIHDLQYGIAHETAHSLAASKVYFTGERNAARQLTGELEDVTKQDGYLSASGLINPPNGFNELVTEMLTTRAVKPQYYSYPVQALLGDAAVREAAAFHKMQPREVEDILIRGYLTGDEKALFLLDEALGDDQAYSLLTMPGKLSPDEGLALAEQLKLPKAAEAITAFKEGKNPGPVFNW